MLILLKKCYIILIFDKKSTKIVGYLKIELLDVKVEEHIGMSQSASLICQVREPTLKSWWSSPRSCSQLRFMYSLFLQALLVCHRGQTERNQTRPLKGDQDGIPVEDTRFWVTSISTGIKVIILWCYCCWKIYCGL